MRQCLLWGFLLLVTCIHYPFPAPLRVVAAEAIIENPNYRPLSFNNTNTTFVKNIINDALGNVSSPRKVIRLIQRHQRTITIVLVGIAFRREINHLLRHIMSQTGTYTRNEGILLPSWRINMSTILQILLLVSLLRSLQNRQASSPLEDAETPLNSILPLLFFLPGQNPASLIFLSRLMASSGVFLPPVEQHYTFENLDQRYIKDAMALSKTLRYNTNRIGNNLNSGSNSSRTNSFWSSMRPAGVTQVAKSERTEKNETVIVVEMTKLDSSLSQLDRIRDQVSFLLSQACQNALGGSSPTEVVILLESPGGGAADYALAAQQLLRLRRALGNLTIIVDKVAASGGYMMACTASKLYAAPFAVVGSIGVMGQIVNFQKTLDSYGIRSLIFRAGRDKVPVGALGEVTEEGLAVVQRMIDRTHIAFQRHVAQARPILADRIEDIATGEIWLGQDALELGLVDKLMTSDEYLADRLRTARVLKLVQVRQPKGPFQRPVVEGSSIRTFVQQWSAQLLMTLRSTIGNALTATGNENYALL